MQEPYPFDLSSPGAFAESFRVAVHGGVNERTGASAAQHLRWWWEGGSEDRQRDIAEGVRFAADHCDDAVRSQVMLFTRHTSGAAMNDLLLRWLETVPNWMEHPDPRFVDQRPLGHTFVQSVCQDLPRDVPSVLVDVEPLAEKWGLLDQVFWARLDRYPTGEHVVPWVKRFLPKLDDVVETGRKLGFMYGLPHPEHCTDIADVLASAPVPAREAYLAVIEEDVPKRAAEVRRRLGL